MRFDPRSLLLVACNALLLYVTLLINASLASINLHLILLGPMIVIPALYLNHTSFFLSTLLTGLWVDAAFPTSFGLFTFSFLALGTILFSIRYRFHAERNFHPSLLAHATNLTCILIMTLWHGHAYFSSGAFWIQVSITTLLSHIALLFVAPWLFDLERLLFKICRLETEPEDLPIT
jgi:hypothetical protein